MILLLVPLLSLPPSLSSSSSSSLSTLHRSTLNPVAPLPLHFDLRLNPNQSVHTYLCEMCYAENRSKTCLNHIPGEA